MARVFVPLPEHDLDPTECAVPWHVLTKAAHEVVFATEGGAVPAYGDFERGPLTLFSHGTSASDDAAFVVEDANFASARWPGDAWLFAKKIAERLPA